ncbi:MAG: class I SAM-dependent methyltransferase [Bacteroidia bacterium]|nr:class I SAM-dependent methyltransferase [Bacteroidia bacterium]
MQYDPIKKSLGSAFNKTPWLRLLLYHLLDLLLLRTWHVKKALKRWLKETPLSLRRGVGGEVDVPRRGVGGEVDVTQRGVGRGAGAGSRILDAGSGFGQYSYFLSKMSPHFMVDAVDVKEEQIADCNRFFNSIGKVNVHFAVANLTTYIKNNSYDLILSVDVMEHILEDEAVFRNFYQSLKPGGMVLISTPSDQGGSDVHDHNEESSFIDEHVRDGYSIHEIQEKLKRAGFEKTEGHYTYGKPGQLGWKLSMKYPIKMLNANKIFFIILPFYYLLTFPFALLFNALDLWIIHKTGTGLIVRAWK